MKKVIEKSRIDPQLVEDICVGNVSDGKAAYKARAASLAAGKYTVQLNLTAAA